jgi:hypothetical protein
MDIKKTIDWAKAGLPAFADSVVNTITDGFESAETVEFRKSKCLTCKLYKEERCNSDIMVNSKDDVITVENAEKGNFIKYKDGDQQNGWLRAVSFGDDLYVRGCGCQLHTGEIPVKWKFRFSKERLELDNGFGDCPRGRWSEKNFEQWKLETSSKS